MRLKSLTLHGFKSFGQKTSIEFEAGITAVVGPNGSGKSNVADAFRWVLGEQSLRALRAKRTEDVIFAGGTGRAPSGMAEVELVVDGLDSASGLPFSELSLLRRAYRSGENEFYLNRERTRLRDILDLVGRVGMGSQGLAVVGQGAVDAALSLRPEDRRAFLEHAAAIGHLHARLEDAVERLGQTRQNLDRVADLLAELSPRLRSLERQARQAREREALQREFIQASARWYAHLLAGPIQQRLSAARQQSVASARLAEVRDQAARADTDETETREQYLKFASLAGATAERLERLAAERAELEREVLVEQERFSEDERRLVESAERAERLMGELQAVTNENLDAASARDDLEGEIRRIDRECREREATVAEGENRRRALLADLSRARQAADGAQSALTLAEARCRTAREQLGALDAARQARETERLAASERLAARERQQQEARAVLDTAAAAHEADAAAATRAREALGEARSELASATDRLAAADRDLQSVRARAEALEAFEESGVGLYPGVRAVLQASNGHGAFHLDGIHGIVGGLIRSALDQELAVETALGGHLQDVVVERWADAEAAIVELKRRKAGRATFLPLDTLRPSRPPAAPEGLGVLGVAARLVDVDSRYRDVADFLLGHTLIVETLAHAREILLRCPPGWQIVTREGDLARPSGAVTGGSPNDRAGRGVLARTRELRQVRRLVAERQREREDRAADVAARRARVQDAEKQAEEARRQALGAEEALRRARHRGSDLEREAEQARRDLSSRDLELHRFAEQRLELEARVVDLETARARAEQAWHEHQEAPSRARQALDAFEATVGRGLADLAARRVELEQLRKRRAAVEASIGRGERRGELLVRDLEEIRRRGDAIRGEIQRRTERLRALQSRLGEVTGTVAEVERERSELRQRQTELNARQDELAAVRRRLEAEEREETAALRNLEHQAERAAAEIDALGRQVGLELGEPDLGAIEEGRLRILIDQQTIEQNIAVADDPDRLRARLETIRGRLRSLPANPEVLAEYEAARERHDFLSGQAEDLQRSVEILQSTIDETRATMKGRFAETFEVVDLAFRRRFAEIFGGGTARLVLEGDDLGAGVEIVAQPPGKRSQNLATLSGGERALAAAALLFALIDVNPPPFCVLDEVDAALDESNVGRFGGILRELSRRTQFVVITHNRRTMEAASAIYGLTLENRSESRVLSMRLPPV